MNKINYKGNTLERLYELALIGADFCTEKNDNGITVVNSLHKQLYMKTVLLSRLLNVIEVADNRVMSLEQYNKSKASINNIEGDGKTRLKADYETFKEMLHEEIQNTITVNNDFLNRLNETIATEMTPENFEKLEQQKNELIEQLNKIKQ